MQYKFYFHCGIHMILFICYIDCTYLRLCSIDYKYSPAPHLSVSLRTTLALLYL